MHCLYFTCVLLLMTIQLRKLRCIVQSYSVYFNNMCTRRVLNKQQKEKRNKSKNAFNAKQMVLKAKNLLCVYENRNTHKLYMQRQIFDRKMLFVGRCKWLCIYTGNYKINAFYTKQQQKKIALETTYTRLYRHTDVSVPVYANRQSKRKSNE